MINAQIRHSSIFFVTARADTAHLHLFLSGHAQVLRINIVYDDTRRFDVPASFRDGKHRYGIPCILLSLSLSLSRSSD